MTESKNPRRSSFLVWMKRKDLRVSDISKKADIPYTTVDSFVKRPSAKMLGENEKKIADAFETTVDEIFGSPSETSVTPYAHLLEDAGLEKISVKQLDVRFGMGGGAVYDLPVEAQPMSFSRAWIRQLTNAPVDELFWASGFGDSMFPTISDGDIVLVDCSQRDPKIRDQIWALNQYGQGMIKRLRATAEGYLIMSDNPQVPAETAADGSMEVVGRVVAVVRRL